MHFYTEEIVKYAVVETGLLDSHKDGIENSQTCRRPLAVGKLGDVLDGRPVDQGIGKQDVHLAGIPQDGGGLQARRVGKVGLAGLEAHTDDQDARPDGAPDVDRGGVAQQLGKDAASHVSRPGLDGPRRGPQERQVAALEQVVRVERDAVAADAQAGVYGQVAERLRGRRRRHFEGIDAVR